MARQFVSFPSTAWLISVLLISASIRSVLAAPNIVVFIADDQSWRDSSVYGATDAITPNMQRLADEGLTFSHAFVASPSCAPSRAALISGLMPARNGAEANHTFVKDGIQTLPSYLHSLGYEVASFGKVCHGDDGRRHGFDHYERRFDIPRIAHYLDQRSDNRPLCLMVGTSSPHVPWPQPDGYDPRQVSLPAKFVDTPATRRFRARYLTDVSIADQQLGQVYRLAQQVLGDQLLFVYTSDHGSQFPFGKWNLYDEGIRVPLLAVWPGTIPRQQRTSAFVSWVDLLPTLIEVAGGQAPDDLDGRSFRSVLENPSESHRDLIYTTHSGDGPMNVYPIRSVRSQRYKYIRNLRPELQFTSHIDKALGNDRLNLWYSWLHAAQTDLRAADLVRLYYQRPAEELYDVLADPDEQQNLAGETRYTSTLTELRAAMDQWMERQADQQRVFEQPHVVGPAGPEPVEPINLRLRGTQYAGNQDAWQFTLDRPEDNWHQPEFDDRRWQVGVGGVQPDVKPADPPAREGSKSNFWLRRWFALQRISKATSLRIEYTGDAQVYVNGHLLAEFKGSSAGYQRIPLNDRQREYLQLGSNLLAVHGKSNGGDFVVATITE